MRKENEPPMNISTVQGIIKWLFIASGSYWLYAAFNHCFGVRILRKEAAGCGKLLAITKSRFSVVNYWKWTDSNCYGVFAGTGWNTIKVFDHKGKEIAELYPPKPFKRFIAEDTKLVLDYDGTRTEYPFREIVMRDTITPWKLPDPHFTQLPVFRCSEWIVIHTLHGKRLVRKFDTVCRMVFVFTAIACVVFHWIR